MVFQQNLLKKSYFIAKMSGQAGQFWLLESALSLNAQRFDDAIQIKYVIS